MKTLKDIKLYESGDELKTAGPTIFLAGPTPRSENVLSWRTKALVHFWDQGYQGSLFLPEPFINKSSNYEINYHAQIEWEDLALNLANIILFWVPRELETMPGFTTNVEFGMWIRSGKVVYGRPDDTPKTKYLDYHANKNGVVVSSTLEQTVANALERLKNVC